MKFEMKSLFSQFFCWLLLVIFLFIQTLLMPYYESKRNETLQEMVLQAENTALLLSMLETPAEDLAYSAAAQAHAEGLESYKVRYIERRRELTNIANIYRTTLNEPGHFAFQEARTRFLLSLWENGTSNNFSYKPELVPAEEVGPEETYGPEKWRALRERLGMKAFPNFKQEMGSVDSMSERISRSEIIYQVELYERGMINVTRYSLNGFVFALELGSPFYVVIYLLFAILLTLFVMQHFSRFRIAKVIVPIIERSAYFRRRVLLSMAVCCVILFGAEALILGLRIALDPSVPISYPLRIVKLGERIRAEALTQHTFLWEILPISVTEHTDFSKLSYVPIGLAVALNAVYRFILISVAVALTGLVYTLKNTWKVLVTIPLGCLAVAAFVGVVRNYGLVALARLFSPTELLQGKGLLPYAQAFVVMSAISILLYFVGSRVSRHERYA